MKNSKPQFTFPLHDSSQKSFASDNYSGVHPSILSILSTVNGGHISSYGNDPYTEELGNLFSSILDTPAKVFPTLTGTGSNILALQAALSRHESVICAKTSHLNVDEGGAPERSGIKLLTVESPNGKLNPELIDREAWGWGDQHRSQPKVVSITQSTELGTLYSLEEIKAIAEHTHSLKMYLHMDGARISNACAALSTDLRTLVKETGVDILSLGGTKNGGMVSEAVVVLNDNLKNNIPYLRKGNTQLISKMRYISAQLLELYGTDLWIDNAQNANSMAFLLRKLLENNRNISFPYPTESNAVFAILPKKTINELQEKYHFYIWDESSNLVRWMTSWDSNLEDINKFSSDIISML